MPSAALSIEVVAKGIDCDVSDSQLSAYSFQIIESAHFFMNHIELIPKYLVQYDLALRKAATIAKLPLTHPLFFRV